ncbi:MAG: hypothetical protein AAGF15_06390 [Pseudomonadota bacterium]
MWKAKEQIGRMTERIELLVPNGASDETGGFVASYTVEQAFWARVTSQKGLAIAAGGRRDYGESISIITYFSGPFPQAARLRVRSGIFQLVSVEAPASGPTGPAVWQLHARAIPRDA